LSSRRRGMQRGHTIQLTKKTQADRRKIQRETMGDTPVILQAMSFNFNSFRSHPSPLPAPTKQALSTPIELGVSKYTDHGEPRGQRTAATAPRSWFFSRWSSSSVASPPTGGIIRGEVTSEFQRNNIITNVPEILQPQNNLSKVTEGCMSDSDAHSQTIGVDNLPPYPSPKTKQTKVMVQLHNDTMKICTRKEERRSKELLLENFPEINAKNRIKRQISKESYTLSHLKQIELEEATFPGYLLYQRAKMHHALGNNSQAIDATTECLAYQQRALQPNFNDGDILNRSAPLNNIDSTLDKINGDASGVDSSSLSMTPLDLRSTYLAGVGSSVLGVVSSLKGGDTKNYPLMPHPCTVQTLLLRGHLMHADESLLIEAAKVVEMAVALQRKIGVVEDLIYPLKFLGKLKTQLRQFEAADLAYREALLIFFRVKQDHTEVQESSERVTKFLVGVTNEIALTLHQWGKSFHGRKSYTMAFHCYNRALRLLNSSLRKKNRIGCRRKTVKSMSSRRALYSLVMDEYWESSCGSCVI